MASVSASVTLAFVGYWNFDDGTAKDLSGHGHTEAPFYRIST
jgi:hypothetical protein